MGHQTCAWPGCPNTTDTLPKVKFHGFPRNGDRGTKWAAITRSPKLMAMTSLQLNERGYRLCTAHFSDGMYMNHQRIRLTHCAVPDRVEEGIPVEGIAKRKADEDGKEISGG